MEVLGLNGVYPRSHDASACLVQEGIIVANVEEERFTRQKKAFDTQPHNAINYCLDKAGVNVNDLEAITFGWRGPEISAGDILPKHIARQLTRELPVISIEHHEAHAASVFYTSPFEESAVLIVDGQGENESTTIWKGGPAGLEKLASYDVSKSLGYLYAGVSRYCGLGSFGAGKVMGLAPYGEPKYTDLLRDVYRSITLSEQTTHDSQDAYLDQFLEKLYEKGFPKVEFTLGYDPLTLRFREEPKLKDVHRDIAASVQELLEQEMLELAKQAKALTGSSYLCLAGGVAMNCVTNSTLQDSGLFKDVFAQPGCEDCGVAMGSALAFTKEKVHDLPIYSGPSFSDEQIGAFLSKVGITSTRHDSIATEAARLIANDTVVGWFQGGVEFGPRALGGRSILANPETGVMNGKVNLIKQREPWRPFGPSVLAERAGDLFENAHESNYMLRSFAVREEWKSRLGAVTHVDGSTRPQTVNRKANERYYDLIQEFGRLTGIPAVLNTSFNNYDEPIVTSPLDAIRTFYSSGLGAIVLGDHLVTK